MTTSYHFQLGDFACIALSDNTRTSTIQQEIADVPPDELSAAMRNLGYATDEVELGYTYLLIKTGERQVLIDTGTGQGQLPQNLQAEGIQASDIDSIIITHGDGDHIGGLLDAQGRLAFPQAQYFMWRDAWAMWSEPEQRAHMVEQFLALMRRRRISESALTTMAERRADYGITTLPLIENKTTLIDLETEFLPGFQAIAAPGHRTDHIALLINSSGQRLLHVADAVRHPIQVAQPTWNGFIDSFPAQAAETRLRLLQQAAAGQLLVCTTHITFPSVGYVREGKSGYSWQAI